MLAPTEFLTRGIILVCVVCLVCAMCAMCAVCAVCVLCVRVPAPKTDEYEVGTASGGPQFRNIMSRKIVLGSDRHEQYEDNGVTKHSSTVGPTLNPTAVPRIIHQS